MEYASLQQRIGAHLLDLFVLSVGMAIIVFAGARRQEWEIALTPVRGTLVVLYTFYFHGKTGQTPGKKWMKIRVVDNLGERIGFGQSARRASMLFLMSIPWPLATVIALQRVPSAQYLALWGHGEAALEASLRPGWYDQAQWCILVLFAIDIAVMTMTKRRKSLHDYVGGTVVVKVSQVKPD